jgi:subtilisin family serine protease
MRLNGHVVLISGVLTGVAASSTPVFGKVDVKTQDVSRRQPPVVTLEAIQSEDLEKVTLPLHRADTRARVNIAERNLRTFDTGSARVSFNPEIVLFRKAGRKEVLAVRVKAGEEQDAVAVLKRRDDIEFATIDTIQTRQFTPTDTELQKQWHHATIDSYRAWEAGTGTHFVTIAIVDTPFQMNHPDLSENVGPGWDVADEMPILTSAGDEHATASAGLAAAVINNRMGVAGASNCRVIPIGINGATSEMYQAVTWAADHDVRVVNISWTGAHEPVLQAAGEYLEEHAQGLLIMPGLNGTGQLSFVNHPNIWCVSMTDAADNLRSFSGSHIDFAAPGWDVYSTTTNNMYGVVRGTSFAAPLFSGIAAVVMSVNPALSATQVTEVLKATAVDAGNPGRDDSYGWGRVNFHAAVEMAVMTIPKISSVRRNVDAMLISVESIVPAFLSLERTDLLSGSVWTRVADVNASSGVTNFEDQSRSEMGIYRVRVEAARD